MLHHMILRIIWCSILPGKLSVEVGVDVIDGDPAPPALGDSFALSGYEMPRLKELGAAGFRLLYYSARAL